MPTDPRYSQYFDQATDLDELTDMEITSSGAYSAPFVRGKNAKGNYQYFTPAFGHESYQGGFVDDVGQRYGGSERFEISPWQNYSNNTYWIPNVEGLKQVKAPWASSLVSGTPYHAGQYSGYGWLSDTPPSFRTWEREADTGLFGSIMDAMKGGLIGPVGGFLGAGAFGSGGLLDFLKSFAGGGAGSAASAAVPLTEAGFGLSGGGYGMQTASQLATGLNQGLNEFIAAAAAGAGGAGAGGTGSVLSDSLTQLYNEAAQLGIPAPDVGIGGVMYSPTEVMNLINMAGELGLNPSQLFSEQLFNPFSKSFTPSAIAEGINASGPMQGVINQAAPSIQASLENPALWNELGAGWEGAVAGNAAAGANMNIPLEYAKTMFSSPDAFKMMLVDSYKQIKDPLKLLGAFRNWKTASDMEKMFKDTMSRFSATGFPHQKYHGLADDFFDPAKRYQMLQNTPGFQESARYAEQAQKRRNARTGDLNSGFGSALIMDALGKNAQSWSNDMFNQIAKASGMDFNNMVVQAQLAGGFLPAIAQSRSQRDQAIFEAIRSNQDYLPEIFKASL